jgi:hypothetical protein
VRLQQSSARKQPFAGLGARQIRDRSVIAFKNARSFRVTGNELDKALGRVTLDYHVSAARAYGSTTSAKGSMDIIRIGNEAWLRYDAKFAKTTASPADGVGLCLVKWRAWPGRTSGRPCQGLGRSGSRPLG